MNWSLLESDIWPNTNLPFSDDKKVALGSCRLLGERIPNDCAGAFSAHKKTGKKSAAAMKIVFLIRSILPSSSFEYSAQRLPSCLGSGGFYSRFVSSPRPVNPSHYPPPPCPGQREGAGYSPQGRTLNENVFMSSPLESRMSTCQSPTCRGWMVFELYVRQLEALTGRVTLAISERPKYQTWMMWVASVSGRSKRISVKQ
jgi:hypothetical protein